jgi:hypothetical protein
MFWWVVWSEMQQSVILYGRSDLENWTVDSLTHEKRGLNRSKKDWHRQLLSGTTVSAKKIVPEETVCAFNHRT